MSLLRRLHPLDLVALALLLLGLLSVATGLLPTGPAGDVLERIAPLLPFLGTVIVLAELTSEAEVFDVLAGRTARAARGSRTALFLLCVGLASLTTVVLNLDTTAVLLTPVMLATAQRIGLPPLPLAMTTVWLANTASLLLPVSNLTNLLAAEKVALSPTGLAARMWAPQLAALAATAACLWLFHWRRGLLGGDGYRVPEPQRPADPVLYRVCGLTCAGFLAAVLVLDAPLWAASSVAAAVAVAAFAVRRREVLRPGLVPWRLLAFVPGLFLVVETLRVHGLGSLVGSLTGADGGLAGLLRTAGVGAGLSNVVNNLPAYLAGEAALPGGGHDPLLALLIGTNAGALVTPWASLATLLWFERCHAQGVRVPLLRFTATSTVLAVTAAAAAVTALSVTG
ncbi:arsenic transporter [Streptacidiphilus sp. ASG 303]|uniref:SLC13 family permease n=1 Tax=Streptacidiphilus sp. ASG 303 TaxID=2896847 RepID=UPI001E3E9235|nr:SLC13 family permease [Streptacidiphilus sp. ASG 303]MCD0481313.1 arsenic transporter [Streptacidiphilus sp. ASG 303]